MPKGCKIYGPPLWVFLTPSLIKINESKHHGSEKSCFVVHISLEGLVLTKQTKPAQSYLLDGALIREHVKNINGKS